MNYPHLTRRLERVVHKYTQNETLKRAYGTDQLLTHREIHTIQLVGDCPGMNLGTLAGAHGVTKGAASQLVSRLCAKGFLQRCASPVSLAEVALFLTPKGEDARRGHEAYHAKTGVAWRAALETLNEHDFAVVEAFLATVETLLDREAEQEEHV